jgi:hypothetical protein
MKASVLGLAAAAALAASRLVAQPTPEFTPTHALRVKPTPPPPATKISGTLECEKPQRTSMDVADAPGHVLSVGKTSCRWTKPLALGKQRTFRGESKMIRDQKGDSALERGYHVGRTGGKGDIYYFRFDGQSVGRGGVFDTIQGRWAFAGGTGELEGLQGQGTYKGTFGENGAATIEMEGEYRLREPAAPGRTP